MKILTALALTVLSADLLSPNAVAAQSSPWGSGTGIGYQTFRFDNPAAVQIKNLSLLVAPFAVRTPLYGASSFEMNGGYAWGSLDRGDGTDEITLSGFTDTDLRVTVPVLGADFVSVSGILSLPTGHATLTRDEAELAGAFAADLLPFRISNWGSGGGIGAGVGISRSIAGFGFRFNGAYIAAREFEPFMQDTFVYRPGNQLRLDASVSHAVGSAGIAELQLSAQQYGEDEGGGRNLYQSGDRYQATTSYAFSLGQQSSGIVYTGVQHRSEGTYLFNPFQGTPGGNLDDTPAQNLFLAGAGARVPLGRSVLIPSVDTRLLRRENGVGQGHITGFGAAVERPFGRITLVPSARARFGHVLVRQETESDVRGADLSLTIRFGGSR